MGKIIIQDMQNLTSQYKHLFNNSSPLFTISVPSINKMSFVSGFTELKNLFKELDPNTIDLGVREFPVVENDEIVGTQDVWYLEFDGQPVFMLRNNKVMNKGHFIIALKRTGFAN
jgi:hypothetical protein